MKYGSLFSGIGGIDLGLERAGMECVWQCEIDEYRRRVLAHHWPNVERFDDVRTVRGSGYSECGPSWQELTKRRWDGYLDSVDLICAGVPCQDVSVAGRRAGLAGERTGLFFEFVRILGELRPRWFLFENVPGLLSSPPARPGADFTVVLSRLAELGYGLAWRILDSRYFGVPQRRRRVYVVGYLGRPDCAAAVLFEPQSGAGDSQAGREAGQDIAAPLRASTYDTGWKGADREIYVPEVAYALAARESKGVSKYESQTTYVSETLRVGGRNDGAGDGSDNTPIIAVRSAQTSSNGWGIQEGETHTLDGALPDAVGVGATVRRLTPVECERLQAFPDGWTDISGATDGKRYAALGDTMTVYVATWLGERIMTVEAMCEAR